MSHHYPYSALKDGVNESSAAPTAEEKLASGRKERRGYNGGPPILFNFEALFCNRHMHHGVLDSLHAVFTFPFLPSLLHFSSISIVFVSFP